MALKKKGDKKKVADKAAEVEEKKSPKEAPKKEPEKTFLGDSRDDDKLKERRKNKREKLKQEKADGKSNPAPDVSPEEREKFKVRAIELITKGLAEDPAEQKKGFPYIPKEWATEFKPVLGAFARFVEKAKEFVLVQGDVPGRFTVHLADGKTVATQKSEWEVKLRNTWQVYLQCTKKDSRQPKEFVQLAMKLAAVSMEDLGASAESAAPKAAASEAKGKKRKKEAKVEVKEEEDSSEEEEAEEKPKLKKKKKKAA